MITRFLALVGIAGPIYYVVIVTVLGLLWAGYDPIRQTQSELGAVGAPHGLVMNVAGFMALGVIILAFAGVYLLALRASPWKLSATVLLAVAGLGMITVGFFPCDAACVDLTRTGELHSTFSMPGAIGLPAAAMLSAFAFRADGRLGTRWQAVSFLLGLVVLASGPIVAADLAPESLGLLQRAAMWTPVLWMSAVSLRLRAMARPAVRGAGRPLGTRLRDGSLAAILRSPLGRFAPGMTVVGFRGRRSGRSFSTPVECVRLDDRLLVFVGRPEGKQWWRNVQANPEVTVEVDGQDVPGRATVHASGGPEAEEDLAAYLEHRTRMARSLGLSRDLAALGAVASGAVTVRIELEPAATSH